MLAQLNSLIKSEADELIWESPTNVCALRYLNFPRLEELTLIQISKGEEAVSVQTAFAELEQELSAS